MKTLNQTNILLRALDLELKAILKKDLENFRAIQKSKNNAAAGTQLLAA